MTKPLDLEDFRKWRAKTNSDLTFSISQIEFTKQQIKSALQGLIEEIRLTDLEWVVYSDGSQKRMSEKERKEIIIEFIRKWFPDVVKDGE